MAASATINQPQFTSRANGVRYSLYLADCLEWMDSRSANSIHAIVTDPPYGLKEYTHAGQSSRGCFAGSGSVSIADNGNVYPCHLFHFDDHLMGNADDDKVGDILFSEKPRGHAIAMDVEPNNDQRSIGRFGFFVERAARRIRCMARVRCSALISIAGS